jgi:phosphopantothenoylcysteine decarboxylase/phosphopantothenate--cysteine ligase
MSVLSGKKIVLGVSGGIAAYKTAYLVRLFIKAGAQVQVIMTPASKDFVTPLTLSTLSKNPVYSTFYNEDDANAQWNNHVDLALWADLMVIAPATANTLSKMVTFWQFVTGYLSFANVLSILLPNGFDIINTLCNLNFDN